MSKTPIGLILGITLITALTASKQREPGRNIVIEGNFYFWDSGTPRDWNQALEYCKGEEAELAKITSRNVYNTLRLSLPAAGYYWIDGKDKETKERFIPNIECSADGLNFDNIQNLEFFALSCLTLVKGADAANSRIEAVSCFPNQTGVICSFPEAAGGC